MPPDKDVHICIHEAELAVVITKIDAIEKYTDAIDKKLETISNAIAGKNGGEGGLVTKTALNSASIKRIWYLITPVSGIIIVGSIKVIFF